MRNPAHSCQLPVSCVATLSAICAYSSAFSSWHGGIVLSSFQFWGKKRGWQIATHPYNAIMLFTGQNYRAQLQFVANFSSVIAQSFVRALSVNSHDQFRFLRRKFAAHLNSRSSEPQSARMRLPVVVNAHQVHFFKSKVSHIKSPFRSFWALSFCVLSWAGFSAAP